MQSSKRYVSFVFSFSVLYFILFKINEVYSQVGEKSRNYCAAQAPAVLDATYLPAIAGGVNVSDDEYPHMAALGFFSELNRRWLCGGSLISNDFVLTAAHCLYSNETGEVKVVRFGTKNIQDPSPGYKDYEISQRIRHPGFKLPQLYNDIGLLRLKTSVAFTSKIKPACLQVDTNFDTTNMTATGWGRQGRGRPRSPHLLKVDLYLYNYTTCQEFYRRKIVYPDGIQPQSMICAGGINFHVRDTCQGDSGGPLQILINQQYYIVGVISNGLECGGANIPGIYMRVSNYTQWIEDTVWK